jgi:hypothetical protein
MPKQRLADAVLKYTGARWVAARLFGASNARFEAGGVVALLLFLVCALWVKWIQPTFVLG